MTTRRRTGAASISWALLGAALLTTAALGCSDQVPVGGFEGGGGAGAEGGSDAGGGDQGGGGASSTGHVRIRMASSTAPFDHQDGLSGQTPANHKSGVRSLTLYRSEDDPSPLVVFDLGSDSVAVDYADGSDTLVHTANIADLADGQFTLARVVHAWVTYDVAATMHTNGLSLPGTFSNFQALSDDTVYEGETYQAGDYDYVFETNGMTFPQSGSGAPVPEYDAGGGFSVRFESGEWAYWFPVSLPIDTSLEGDFDVILSVNMNESFRWQDEAGTGYQDGVFDTTPTGFEPVLRFGANSFDVDIE